ncbi:MAG: hypothetical protein QNJ97_27120 [Myxococcota bacterium]|nr:hypothetical protein [Myxococcota bacterium]
MSEYKQGTVTVTLSDDLTLPEAAGRMSKVEVQRIVKPRKNLEAVCEAVAQAMRKYPDRIRPMDITADGLTDLGDKAMALHGAITDVSTIMTSLQQGDLIFSAMAHEGLRRVLAFVRSAEKFDPRLPDLVPELIDYFSSRRQKPPETNAPSAVAPAN